MIQEFDDYGFHRFYEIDDDEEFFIPVQKKYKGPFVAS